MNIQKFCSFRGPVRWLALAGAISLAGCDKGGDAEGGGSESESSESGGSESESSKSGDSGEAAQPEELTEGTKGQSGMVLTSEDTILLATEEGVKRSTDGGESWKTVALEGDESVLAIGKGSVDGTETLYAMASGNEGTATIARSTDDGATWSKQENNLNLNGSESVAVAPDGTLYHGSSISSDGGESWSQGAWTDEHSGMSTVNDLAVTSDGTVYVAVSEGAALKKEGTPSRVYASAKDDDGWSHVEAEDDFTALGVAAGGAVLAATGEGAMYRTTDGGESWEQVEVQGLNMGVNSFATREDGVIVASHGGQGLIRSEDDGKSWSWLRDIEVRDDKELAFDSEGNLLLVDSYSHALLRVAAEHVP